MKKNTLIKLLEQIEGNPDILLYNGFVDDFMDFEVSNEPYVLVKHSVDFIHNRLRYDFHERNKKLPSDADNQQLRAQAETLAKTETWEFPNEFVTQDDAKQWYGTRMKKVFMIEAKRRNKTCYDRAGGLEY